jgi:small subunit ribosomal protein S2
MEKTNDEQLSVNDKKTNPGQKLENGNNEVTKQSGNETASNKLLPLPKNRLPEIEELLKAGVHFGHQKGRWEPAARNYIFGERNGVHIIDLNATQNKLELALNKIKEIINNNGKVFFVGTKRQVKDLIASAAAITGMPYVTERWLGGTFTNFTTMNRRIQKLLDIERKSESGELNRYTKKEQMKFKKIIRDFEKNMGGIKTLTDLPEAIFVVGVKEEKTAVAEANKTGVNVIAISDTNINPKNIDYPIPGNDDAIKSVQLILQYVVREINEAKSKGVASSK